MKISYHWLSQFLPLSLSIEELKKILTDIGLEVESVEKYESIRGGLEGIVVGEVLSCTKHPKADKLKITQVKISINKTLQIVCGAANVAPQQKVAVALLGTTLYPSGNKQSICIQQVDLRGVTSEGMLCAEDEIGLGTSHEGIMVLPAQHEVGTSLSAVFPIYTDWIFEIGLTPNRSDAYSHYGVARDVCAFLSYHKKKIISPVLPSILFPSSLPPSPFKIKISTPQCYRYAGILLENVEIKESPPWLQHYLMTIGQKPINNVVDITNYLLHTYGHPLHAFDADTIQGQTIQVVQHIQNALLCTLDGTERKIQPNDIVIADINNHPLCLGGVMGGKLSSVQKHTKRIFLESAHFSATQIRQTSMAHHLRTEAALHFEKGIDPSILIEVLQRAALLLVTIAGAKITTQIVDEQTINDAPHRSIATHYNYIQKLSGKQYSNKDIDLLFTCLGFTITQKDLHHITVRVPYHKNDIFCAADLVEEIVRIDGLNNIEVPSQIKMSLSALPLSQKKFYCKEKISEYLIAIGLFEIYTNSISHQKYYKEKAIPMINSLSEELNVMRPSMIESGLDIIAYHIHRQQKDLQLFEYGKTYHTHIKDTVSYYVEKEHFTLFFTGNQAIHWQQKDHTNGGIAKIKQVLFTMMNLLGIDQQQIQFKHHTSESSILLIYVNESHVGEMGIVSSSACELFDIKQTVWFVDICYDWMSAYTKADPIPHLFSFVQDAICFQPIPKFPMVYRDLSIIIKKTITFGEIEQFIKQLKVPFLQSFDLFDRFEHEKINKDQISLSFHFSFQDMLKTLTDVEIDTSMKQIMEAFEQTFACEIRKK